MAPDDEPKVKDLLAGRPLSDVIDAATQRELERWFGAPSAMELRDRGVEIEVEDPAIAEVKARRQAAIALVDPGLLEWIRMRTQVTPETLIQFDPKIELKVDPGILMIDADRARHGMSFSDTREVEIAERVQDDLKECTPQALLRDLHRPELDFDKTFEIVDIVAEQRVDASAEVARVMRTSWKVELSPESPVAQGHQVFAELRAARQRPWVELLPLLPNRRETR
jgi:hypothetical protein